MKKQKKKKILDGHKKVGSKFIPPMNQLEMMKSYSYIDQMLPELIWIGLINDNLGFIKGARFIEKIFLAMDELKKDDHKNNYVFASAYKLLDEDNKNIVIQKLKTIDVLEDLQNFIAPLTLLYDEFPMMFIGPPSVILSQDQLIKKISVCVEKHYDKYETPGIVLNGSILLSRLVTKKIHFPSDMKLPDFNAVIDNPDSKEASRAASFMRANAMAEFGMLGIDNSWAKYFWNRGFELSPCDLRSEQEHNE